MDGRLVAAFGAEAGTGAGGGGGGTLVAGRSGVAGGGGMVDRWECREGLSRRLMRLWCSAGSQLVVAGWTWTLVDGCNGGERVQGCIMQGP